MTESREDLDTRNGKRAHFDTKFDISAQGADSTRRIVPSLFLKRKSRTPASANGVPKRKSDIKLTDYGVTFERYRNELEKGIIGGVRPHFGFPTLKFNDIKDGLGALNLEDSKFSVGIVIHLMDFVKKSDVIKWLKSEHSEKGAIDQS